MSNTKKPIKFTKFSLIMRLLVAVYLLYTVWQIRDGLFTTTGKEQILLIIFAVFFVICAVYLGVVSIKRLASGDYIVNSKDEEEMEQTIEQVDEQTDLETNGKEKEVK